MKSLNWKVLAWATVMASGLGLGACASQPETGKPATGAEAPVAHEYRTGSILAQKEKRPVTEEERRRAAEQVQEIRSAPQTIVGRP